MIVRLLAAGDLCPGDHYFSLGHGTGSRLAGGANPFSEIQSLLSEADVRIANLEGPLSRTSYQDAGPEADVFRGPPLAASIIKQAGIDLVHVANNHILQHGPDAFRETLRLLEEMGISAIGLVERDAVKPVIRVVNGVVLGFLGFSFVPERYLPGQSLYAASPLEVVLEEVKKLRNHSDVVVLSIHWGTEATAIPDRPTVDAAHAMIDAGATLILGHHPHWFQPVERVGRALVAYSLGDFVFDLFWDRRLVESALLSIDLDAGGVMGHRLIPVRFERDYQLRTLSDLRARRFLEDLSRNQELLSTAPSTAPSPITTKEAVSKLAYFLSVLHRGNTSQKMRFVFRKIASTFERAYRATREA